MKKLIGFALLSLCFYPPGLHAQEMAGQGWTASESRQSSSKALPPAETGSARDQARMFPETSIPGAVQNGNGKDRMPPFPVLMPKAIAYPRKAIRKGWEGQTVVAAEILPDGSVGRTALAKTSGHEVLDVAAREAIKDWKFSTESEKDAVVPQYVDIPVTFKLEDR